MTNSQMLKVQGGILPVIGIYKQIVHAWIDGYYVTNRPRPLHDLRRPSCRGRAYDDSRATQGRRNAVSVGYEIRIL